MEMLPFRFRAAPAWSENQCVLQMGKPLCSGAATGHQQTMRCRTSPIKDTMASTYRFIADPSSPQPVVEWLRALPVPPEEVPTERGIVFYFRACGSLSYAADKTVVAEESPVATLFLPRVERGVLWTVGELHFRTTRLRERFPDLAKIQVSFSKWLRSHACVSLDDASDTEFRYFLEGSVKNYYPVYAFPSGMAALQAGRYFVGDGDNEHVLDKLCGMLRLRGVSCIEG